MFVVRFELKNGKGAIQGRSSVKSDKLHELLNDLCFEHDAPQVDWDPPLRDFYDATRGREKFCRFAFTPQAFEYSELATLLVKISKFKDEVRMRVIVDPEVVWVGASGIQCVFIDEWRMNRCNETSPHALP